MADKVRVVVNGEAFDVFVMERTRSAVAFEIGGRAYQVEIAAEVQSAPVPSGVNAKQIRSASVAAAPSTRKGDASGASLITAPMPGVVVEVLVAVGEQVQAGMVVVRLEAMKMQNNILAMESGKVLSIFVSPGDEVADAQLLMELQGPS